MTLVLAQYNLLTSLHEPQILGAFHIFVLYPSLSFFILHPSSFFTILSMFYYSPLLSPTILLLYLSFLLGVPPGDRSAALSIFCSIITIASRLLHLFYRLSSYRSWRVLTDFYCHFWTLQVLYRENHVSHWLKKILELSGFKVINAIERIIVSLVSFRPTIQTPLRHVCRHSLPASSMTPHSTALCGKLQQIGAAEEV